MGYIYIWFWNKKECMIKLVVFLKNAGAKPQTLVKSNNIMQEKSNSPLGFRQFKQPQWLSMAPVDKPISYNICLPLHMININNPIAIEQGSECTKKIKIEQIFDDGNHSLVRMMDDIQFQNQLISNSRVTF